MRIQETDRILKESRYARQAAGSAVSQDDAGVMSRAWRVVSSLPGKVTGLFRKH